MKIMGFIAAAGTDEELVMRSYRGASMECERHGYHMSFSTSGGNYEIERQEVYRMFEAGYKGVVLFPTARTQKQLKEDYLKNELQDFPIVLLDIAYPEQKRSQVVFDNYTAGYDMTEMLINKGHKHIAFMEANSPDGDYMQKSILERYQGYMDAMRNNHLTPRPEDHWIIYHRISRDETYDGLMSKLAACLHKWLDDECPPSALLALEDLAASCITSLARELGINMPSQLEVVGFDNLRVGKSCIPPFSTTDPDFTCAGKIAARTAIRQIEGIQTTVPIVQVLPVPLKIRSTAEIESITECVR
jgi:DNA-binding LacI/PurR family transcriptional regulator